MKTILTIFNWINSNEYRISLIYVMIYFFASIFYSEFNELIAISIILPLYFVWRVMRIKLLGMEYENRVMEIIPGPHQSYKSKLFLIAYILLAIVVANLMYFKVKGRLILFITLIVISLFIGISGIIKSMSKAKLTQTNIRKILILTNQLIVYADEKHKFAYDNSVWDLSSEYEIMLSSKSGFKKSLIINLRAFRKEVRKMILREFESRIEK